MRPFALIVAACFVAAAAFRITGTTAAPVRVPAPAAPVPPRAYLVPAGAVRVSTADQLRAALTRSTPTTIVLADGTYDAPGPFSNRYGHRLYAAHLGKAVLRAGLVIGSNEGGAGALVRGLAFDVADPAKTFDGAAIAVWGAARGARILDTRINGRNVVPAGIVARQTDGFRARRIAARNFTSYGIEIDANDPAGSSAAPSLLEDADVANVSRRPPRSSDGTAEACIWLGAPGLARRLRVRNCAWMGIWTGSSATGVHVADADIGATRTGVYIEHFTHDSTFERVHVRPDVRIGVLAEWASPEWGGEPASVDNVIRQSTFESALCGVYLDEGTTRTSVRGSVFRNQSWAGIGNYLGRGNTFAGNDYSGIRSSAVPVSHGHISGAR